MSFLRKMFCARPERLEPRNLLAATPFSDRMLIDGPAGIEDAAFLQLADFDSDGDDDILTATYQGDEVVWYENDNGAFSTEARHPVGKVRGTVELLAVGNLDDDQDLDVIAVGSFRGGNREIKWYSNGAGSGVFLFETEIAPEREKVEDLEIVDIDGDGDNDIVVAHYNRIDLYENQDGRGNFRFQFAITRDDPEIAALNDVNDIHAADMDGDGDADLLVAADRFHGKDGSRYAFWFENDGSGEFVDVHQIPAPEQLDELRWLTAGDFDADGDADVAVSSFPDGLTIFENTENEGLVKRIQFPVPWLESVLHFEDLDRDGDNDLLLSRKIPGGQTRWFENTDGNGEFVERDLFGQDLAKAIPTDLDSDGNVEIVALATGGRVHGSIVQMHWGEFGQFEERRSLFASFSDVSNVAAHDIDFDGDQDLIVLSDGKAAPIWYENVDQVFEHAGTLVEEKLVDVLFADINRDGSDELLGIDANGSLIAYQRRIRAFERAEAILTESVQDVQAGDLDGDRDNDLVVSYANGLAWLRNQNGQFELKPISENRIDEFTIGDLVGDGTLDIVTAGSDGLTLHVNDGQGQFNPINILNQVNVPAGAKPLIVDLGNNGAADIVVTVEAARNTILWLESDVVGEFQFERRRLNSAEQISGLQSVDLDLDGDFDFVAIRNNQLVEIENEAGEFVLRNNFQLLDTHAENQSLLLMDVDNDLDADVFYVDKDRQIGWFENEINRLPDADFNSDGTVNAADIDLIATAIRFRNDDPRFDLTNDGAVDLLDHRFLIRVILGTDYGDSNLDGQFNSSDLVSVFQAGKFEQPDEVIAGWAEGDWDGRGDFEAGDLVLAFTVGHYEMNAATSSVKSSLQLKLIAASLDLDKRSVHRR